VLSGARITALFYIVLLRPLINDDDDDDGDDDDSCYHGNVSQRVELPLMIPDDGVSSRTPALQPRTP